MKGETTVKRLGLLALLLVLAAAMTAGVAGASITPPQTGAATTGASVDAGTTAPSTVAAWMLPDMNSANGSSIDLVPPYEDAPGAGPVTVTPNLYDSPLRYMGFWAVMTSAAGIGDIQDVWVDVYHPDGTFKYQRHMQRQTCSSLGVPTTVGTPAAGAVTTQQQTASEFTLNPGGILDQCNQGLYAIYFVATDISKDQPFGVYTYAIGASSLSSATSKSGTRQFEVLQKSGLALDFTTVDFGIIAPTSYKITDGDAIWGGALPTIASVGNVWLNLKVDFDPMVGTGPLNLGKLIDLFDVTVGAPSNNPFGQSSVTIDPIPAFAGTTDAVTVSSFFLPSDCPVKVQFSIHPEVMGPGRATSQQTGVPAGPYAGAIKLTGVSAATQWPTGWATGLAQCAVAIPAP